MTSQIADLEIRKTDSVLEALILEANLIKALQPKYNVERKDDKSFNYAVITRETYPRIEIVRESDLNKFYKDHFSLSKKTRNYQSLILGEAFGPYTSKKQLEIALKIIRKIFPFHSLKQRTEKGCLDFQLGHCPGPYAGKISQKDYLRNIRGIRMILAGKKKNLIKKLEKEMRAYSQKKEFEKAAHSRNQIFALKHLEDVALISSPEKETQVLREKARLRIEAYDISNISGRYAVGAMVVFENAEPNKNEYRKFRIKTVTGINDTSMLAEVLFRRFQHPEWPQPDLLFLDGGSGQLNLAKKILEELKLKISLVAVAKGPTRKKLDLRISIIKLNREIKEILSNKLLIRRIMDEAHRFALAYHKKLRKKNFFLG